MSLKTSNIKQWEEIEILRKYLREEVFKAKKFDNINLDLEETIFNNVNGFFPYCSGLFDSNASSTKKDILILGQDFGSNEYIKKIKKIAENEKSEREEDSQTFKTLKSFFKENDEYRERIFLSNVFIGLRKGKLNTGDFPQLYNSDYLSLCKKFLTFEIRELKPKVIITLGKDSFRFLRNNFIEDENYPISIKKLKNLKEDFNIAEKQILGNNIYIIPSGHSSWDKNFKLSKEFLLSSLKNALKN